MNLVDNNFWKLKFLPIQSVWYSLKIWRLRLASTEFLNYYDFNLLLTFQPNATILVTPIHWVNTPGIVTLLQKILLLGRPLMWFLQKFRQFNYYKLYFIIIIENLKIFFIQFYFIFAKPMNFQWYHCNSMCAKVTASIPKLWNINVTCIFHAWWINKEYVVWEFLFWKFSCVKIIFL